VNDCILCWGTGALEIQVSPTGPTPFDTVEVCPRCGGDGIERELGDEPPDDETPPDPLDEWVYSDEAAMRKAHRERHGGNGEHEHL
jgi:hypothetical protein